MNSEEGSEQGNDTSGNMEQQPPQETTTETPPTTENSSTSTTETPNTTTNQQPPTGPQIGRPHVTVTQRAGGGRNVDIIVAMNPDDDSFQQGKILQTCILRKLSETYRDSGLYYCYG